MKNSRKKTAVILMTAVMTAVLVSCEQGAEPESPEASAGENRYDGYVNVEELGIYGNDDDDDWEAVNQALKEGKSLYFGTGTYRFSKPLELKDQNIAGVSFSRTELTYTGTDKQPLIRAQGVCGIADMSLTNAEGILTGQEKAGENVLIWLGGEDGGGSPGSYVRNVCLYRCGTAVYAPPELKAAACGVVFDTLEVCDMVYRGFDLQSTGRVGNTYSNIYFGAAYGGTNALTDAVFALEGSEQAAAIHQLNVEHSNSRQPIILNGLRDMTATAIHIEGMNVGQADRGYLNIANTSGVIRGLSVYWSRLTERNSSTIRLGDAAEGGSDLRIETFHMKGINDPANSLHGEWPVRGIHDGVGGSYRMFDRVDGARNAYRVTVDSYVYFTFQNDRTEYDTFPCDDAEIEFIRKGQLPAGGPTAGRPVVRLCIGHTTYFDTDLGRSVVWDGSSWR